MSGFKPKRIDIAEFREFGFLQEANRQFFHPLGLALEVVQEECERCGGDQVERYPPAEACTGCDGAGFTERLGGVWDYRDDPEGMLYGEGMIDPEKIARVKAERDSHVIPRIAQIKSVIQRPVQSVTQPKEDTVKNR